MPTVDEDREAILKVHRDWWAANYKWDIPLMRTCFPSGAAFLNFNLSGDPYFGREELTAFWDWFKDTPRSKPAVMHIWRQDVRGDMAYLLCEGNFETAEKPDQYLRSTEIYVRNDGEGKPEWKIWHFHCSEMAPQDKIRQPFGDSYASRGVGYLPPSFGKSFSVTDDQKP
ncbi:nuclear transport factor 2 family protein [Bradyrhizobium sp. SSUT18]|uniref:YybH family protein n=1 Tax=Bradyrhizobium sp. SSUT18 TaxID=3040602 RepID=UPI00244D7B6C|nr:nuclear transport factor 2 family protein [Bradyrhizobium sp. SSUT18]MDH2400233.1 nuclear transport factor 2 family protein [Bradyrhizobium sp. SSUT18]